MKFKVKYYDNFWQVGFMNPRKQWVCLQACNSKTEAEELCNKMIGGGKYSSI